MKIAVIYGGKSPEHNVSLRSITNVISQIELLGYHAIPIAVSEFGRAYLQTVEAVKNGPMHILTDSYVFFAPGEGIVDAVGSKIEIDCAFPLIHGTYGEDGCLQGMLEICNIPYVGEKVLTSALCMDKHFAKLLLQQSNINVVPYVVLNGSNTKSESYDQCVATLGHHLIVKPASSGSSFGVTSVSSKASFDSAVADAFAFSSKVLVEKYIKGREINCALRGVNPEIADLGEIVNVKDVIYSYDEKYISKSNELMVPAQLSASVEAEIKALAQRSYKALGCKSMARVDIFFSEEEQLFVNEINTIPAFSKYSIYPRLFESVNVPQKLLIQALIFDAIGRVIIA